MICCSSSSRSSEEGRVDLLGGAAGLVDLGDPPLEVHPGFEGAEHLVRGAEDALEEAELLREQLEDPLSAALARLRKLMTTTLCFWP